MISFFDSFDINRADFLLEVKDLIDIYMAGNSDGFEKIRPEQIGLMFNLLLSYEYHKKKPNLDKLIPLKKRDNDIRLFLAGQAFKDDDKKINTDRLLSYLNDTEKIKEFINGYIYGRSRKRKYNG